MEVNKMEIAFPVLALYWVCVLVVFGIFGK